MNMKEVSFIEQSKTIDELIERVELVKRTTFRDRINNITVYDHIFFHDKLLVLKILQSKDNTPSIHDMMIVQRINKYYGECDGVAKKIYSEMLKVYSNRK